MTVCERERHNTDSRSVCSSRGMLNGPLNPLYGNVESICAMAFTLALRVHLMKLSLVIVLGFTRMQKAHNALRSQTDYKGIKI